ncbi:TlpA family protein disulfide reductase [Aquiflexum sp.]|uniref:TlpA family protein disulfide reductase n=1 Tax=Aquiflexum sp. TaxID=1872584 RepID=UPI0035941DFA
MVKKTLIFILIAFLALFQECREKQKAPEIKFDLKGESKLTFKNLSNSPVQVKFEKWSSIPVDFVDINAVVDQGESYSVNLKNHSMDYIYLDLNKVDFNVFMLPGSNETITIYKNDSIDFSGSLESINQFLYQNSKKDLGFNKLNHVSAMATHGEKEFKRFIQLSDSVHQVQLKNLESNKSYLPDWYVKLEKERLAYRNVANKMNSISYRKSMLKIEDEIPEGFMEELAQSVQLENEKFIGESNYMLFLHEYANFHSQKLSAYKTDSSDTKQSFIILKAQEIDKLFAGKVKDAYLAELSSMLIKNVRSEYDSLVLNYFTDEELRDLIREFYESSVTLKPGTQMPYFFLENQMGEDVESKDYLGNILLINFWADWCKPCIEEFPHENALVEKYKGKPVKFLNICIESKPERWKEYIRKYDLKMDNLFAEENWTRKLKNDYGILGIPHSVLIDWNGNIVENKTRTASRGIDKLIDELLEEMKSPF